MTTGINGTGKVPVNPKPAYDTGFYGDTCYELDPSDLGLYPYGDYVQTVIVVGYRLQIDPWWTFPLITGSSSSLPYPTDPCVGGAGNKIDWNFIGEREAGPGVDPLKVDIPKDPKTGQPLDSSGPTVAHGFDIGNHTVSDLRHMGLSDNLITALTPYTAPSAGHPFTGQAALDYVTAHPLTLSDADASAIDAAAHSEALTRVINDYDNATGRQGAFFALPSEAQTIIASVSFQYGSLSSTHVSTNGTAAGTFWNHVVNDNWSAAVNDLRNFGDKYPSRRNTEANYLNAGIYMSKLTDGSPC